MLLENLIDTATTEIGLEKKIIISHIGSFIEKYGSKEFGVNEKFPYFSQFVKVLLKFDLLKTDFKYRCNDYMATEDAQTFDERCAFCGNKIHISKSGSKHEITLIYSFRKKIIHEVYGEIDKMIKENNVDNYVMEGYKVILNDLISLKEKVVPFIGSGVSTPFNLPNWAGMLTELKNDHLQESRWGYYDELIDEGDYLEALSLLKKSSNSLDTDRRIQEKIQEIFEEKINLNLASKEHNYSDLIKMNSNFYLTTNYDNIFTSLRSKDIFVPPLVWSEIDNLQKFLIKDKGSMIHLHGVVHKPTTMIVTKENYENLYQDSEFQRILTTFMSNRVLLFIGFSFNDKFFQNLFEDIINKVNGEHYLLAPNISRDKAREFSQKGLKVIGLNIKTENGKLDKSDLILGLRSILQNFYTE